MRKRVRYLLMLCLMLLLTGCSGQREQSTDISKSLQYTGKYPLRYAKELEIDNYEKGYCLVNISGERRYLVIPEEGSRPEDLPEDIICLQKPLDQTYLAATAVMDMICELDADSHVRFTSIKASDWSIEKAAEKMRSGEMLYGGKYSMPDYESLVAGHCSLAIENTMILHSPKVMEELNAFGIPVLIDKASYEQHPLGRVEWIKLYGILFDRQQQAEEIFRRQEEKLVAVSGADSKENAPTVAFFYIGENGTVSVRSGQDFIPKMIEMAGGNYLFSDLVKEDSHRVSVNLQMESFYEKAVDADILIYNNYTERNMTKLSELTDKMEQLKDFKAVRQKKVWCVQKDLYQQPLSTGEIITDFHKILSGETDLTYLYPLE